MALATFTPFRAPDPGTQDQPEVKLLIADFGDGYTQSSPDGLNHIRRQLTLTWSALTPTQANTLLNFVRGKNGCIPFLYTPSDETTPVQWICKTWNDRRDQQGFRTVNLTLTQDFSIV